MVVKEFDLTNTPAKTRRLAVQESTVLSSLSHPNIIAYYDMHESKGERRTTNYIRAWFDPQIRFTSKWSTQTAVRCSA